MKAQIFLDLDVPSADDVVRLAREFHRYAEVISVSARCDLVVDFDDDSDEEELGCIPFSSVLSNESEDE